MEESQPKAASLPNKSDPSTKMKTWTEAPHPERFHSLPFLPAKCDDSVDDDDNDDDGDGDDRSATRGTLIPRGSPISTTVVSSCFSNDHAIRHGSYLSAELSVSSDGFAAIQDLACSTTSLPREGDPLPSLKPQSRSFLDHGSCFPRLASHPHSSGTIPHMYSHLRHDADPYDLKRRCNLKEALELLPDELCDSGYQHAFNFSTSQIIPPGTRPRQDKVVKDREVSKYRVDGYGQLRSRFYSQKAFEGATSQKHHNKPGDNAIWPPRSSLHKLVRPLTWIHSKLLKRSLRPNPQEELPQTNQPVKIMGFGGSATGSRPLLPLHPPGLSSAPLAQSNRLERDTQAVVYTKARRLSITGTFGSTLSESLEAILDPQSSTINTPVSSRTNLSQPDPNALGSRFSN